MTVESNSPLWLQRLVIGFKISRQFFNQREGRKTKSNRTLYAKISQALINLQVTANYFDIGF